MPTNEQILTSRQNGSHSRGPVTLEGKAASRRNAIKDGLFISTALMSPDERETHDAFCEGIIQDLRPTGAFELQLAGVIAHESWRLKRIYNREQELQEAALIDRKNSNRYVNRLVSSDKLDSQSETCVAGALHGEPLEAERDQAFLGIKALSLITEKEKLLDTYRQRANREVERNLRQLRQTQAARREREAAEQEALARVGRLLRFDRMMAQANPENHETTTESTTYSDLGFVFSTPEIDRQLHLVDRTQQAALAEKCNWNHRKFEEEWQKRAA